MLGLPWMILSAEYAGSSGFSSNTISGLELLVLDEGVEVTCPDEVAGIIDKTGRVGALEQVM
jgi:hypothetical protein